MPAFFNSLALLISLAVQTIISPLAGAWLLFLYAGCAAMYAPTASKGPLWWCCLAWLCTLGIATFLLAPIANGALWMWWLAAMPLIALCVNKKHLRGHLIGFAIVLALYAVGLIVQAALDVRYSDAPALSMSVHSGWSWPLLDANNAAAVLNAGVIASLYLALSKDKRWFALFALFAYALTLTHSRAGFLGAGLGCFMLLWSEGYLLCCLAAVTILPAAAVALHACRPEATDPALFSLLVRADIWKASLPLLAIRPLTGLGLGSFGYYYAKVRTEHITAGVFAHNDPLQLAIEMGIPAAFVFLALIMTVAATTCRRNIAASAIIASIFTQSLVEFQFYVPPVSLLTGLALAYHIHNRKTQYEALSHS